MDTDASPGDFVEVLHDGRTTSGTLMPQEGEALIIKLENGYNIGIDKRSVTSVQVVRKMEERAASVAPVNKVTGLPTIYIIHTGGTIASKVDYRTGGVIARFGPEDLLQMFPRLAEIANVEAYLLSNMWSEDMRFAHYKIMAREVQKCVEKGAAGVIIAHGTDTLGYTAAALAFALENVPIPVLLVGAQRSSDRGSTDAQMNLVCAAEFITKTDFSGVAICMHHHSSDDVCAILPACKTRKMHSSRRDAFVAVNDTPIATVTFPEGLITFIKVDYARHDPQRRLVVRDGFDEKVGILRVHPNMVPAQFSFFKDYKALVIEGFALGQLPIDAPNEAAKPNLLNRIALKELIDSGCVVAITSQCIFGRVHPHVYSKAIDIANMGAVYTEDMLTETAFIKLAWLLGNHPHDKAKELLVKNLRGEITARSRYSEDYIG